MQKVINAHCHIYPEKIAQKASHAIGDFYGIKMCFEGDFESLKKQVERAGTTLAAVHSAAAARSAEGHQRYTKAAVLSYWKNCYASLLPQAQPVPQARGDLHL